MIIVIDWFFGRRWRLLPQSFSNHLLNSWWPLVLALRNLINPLLLLSLLVNLGYILFDFVLLKSRLVCLSSLWWRGRSSSSFWRRGRSSVRFRSWILFLFLLLLRRMNLANFDRLMYDSIFLYFLSSKGISNNLSLFFPLLLFLLKRFFFDFIHCILCFFRRIIFSFCITFTSFFQIFLLQHLYPTFFVINRLNSSWRNCLLQFLLCLSWLLFDCWKERFCVISLNRWVRGLTTMSAFMLFTSRNSLVGLIVLWLLLFERIGLHNLSFSFFIVHNKFPRKRSLLN